MQTRTLGKSGLRTSTLGLGCMGMSEFDGDGGEAESLATIHRAVERGVVFLDTADMRGVGRNEELVGKAIQGVRDQVCLATKFGNMRGADGSSLLNNTGNNFFVSISITYLGLLICRTLA